MTPVGGCSGRYWSHMMNPLRHVCLPTPRDSFLYITPGKFQHLSLTVDGRQAQTSFNQVNCWSRSQQCT